MTNQEKRDLSILVKTAISLGFDMKATDKRLKGMGFKPATIRKYYKTFSKLSEPNLGIGGTVNEW